jgi:hypothetical protein
MRRKYNERVGDGCSSPQVPNTATASRLFKAWMRYVDHKQPVFRKQVPTYNEESGYRKNPEGVSVEHVDLKVHQHPRSLDVPRIKQNETDEDY